MLAEQTVFIGIVATVVIAVTDLRQQYTLLTGTGTVKLFVRITAPSCQARTHTRDYSVIFVNENENENGEKRENNEFVNEN